MSAKFVCGKGAKNAQVSHVSWGIMVIKNICRYDLDRKIGMLRGVMTKRAVDLPFDGWRKTIAVRTLRTLEL